MSKVATVLKEEISRIARKETRGQISGLKRASTQYRRQIASLKAQLAGLERRLAVLSKQPRRIDSANDDTKPLRFVPKGLRTLRQRLGLTMSELAGLLDVSSQSVYNWERKQTKPRNEQLRRIAQLRSMGKRDVAKLMAQKAEE